MLEVFFGNTLISYGMAQFFYGFFTIGIAMAAFGIVFGIGKVIGAIYRKKDIKKPLGTVMMAVFVMLAIGYIWPRYEEVFFECEKTVAIESDSMYSCRMKETKDGPWSVTRSFTKGTEPYKKYNRDLYK